MMPFSAARKTVLRAGILLCALSFSASQAAEFPEDSRVLFIYGNPDIGPWEQLFNQTLLNELATVSGIPAIPEFLSLIDTPELQQQYMAESLRLKYTQLSIDLIIAVLPDANSFVHRWASVFAPEAAILHVLPGNDVLDAVEPSADRVIMQSAVEPAIRMTVELIPKLLPDLEHLYIVGGSSDSDLSYQTRTERAVLNSDIDYEFTILSGLTPEELLARLDNAPPNSAILLIPYDRDHTGQPLRVLAINTLLEENIPLPVFGAFDTLLESGTLGGNMTSSALYARTSAEVARDILDGTVDTRVIDSQTSYMFNAAKLNAFSIDRRLLPAGSLIVNEQPDFWRDYSPIVITGSIIMALQLGLIALLIETMRRRKAAEAELKQAQRMEALGSLSGGIAHDFNNILMSIMANAELAGMKPNDEGHVKTRVRNILSASGRARDLIAQILMFSQQSAGAELKPLQINAVLEESAEHLRSFLPHACSLSLDLQDELPTIRGDATQIHQVVMNICVNAQHAMEDSGAINIDTSLQNLDQPLQTLRRNIPAGEYVVVNFSDTGSGIDKESLQHIFEPFFTTKPRGKGTGLGLALVYQIVKAHNAYIDLQSTPGKGTKISLYFPTSGDHSISDPALESEQIIKGQGELILLVDDDEMVLDANAHSLGSIGYRIKAFANSVAALNWARNNGQDIDLIYSDLSMPEMDGVRLISSIRELFPNVPAMISTGYLESIDDKAFNNIAVLHKPTDLKQVASAIHTLLASKQA